MKIFIIFCAFLLVVSFLIVFDADMNKYIRLQKDLKTLCEDVCNMGALTIDERKVVIDEKKAKKECQNIINTSKLFPEGSVRITSFEITKNGRGLKICLEYSCEDIFRLPFITVTKLRRISEYAWE